MLQPESELQRLLGWGPQVLDQLMVLLANFGVNLSCDRVTASPQNSSNCAADFLQLMCRCLLAAYYGVACWR